MTQNTPYFQEKTIAKMEKESVEQIREMEKKKNIYLYNTYIATELVPSTQRQVCR